MRRLLSFLSIVSILGLAACGDDDGRGPGPIDGSVAQPDGALPGVDAGSTPGRRGTVGTWCTDSSQCTGGTPHCCLRIAGFSLVGTCVADPSACGSDSRLSCDDSEDCPGAQVCCARQQGTSSGNIVISECRDACGGFAGDEICQGAGSAGACSRGGFCCQDASDDFGECAATESACPAPEMR